MILEKLANSIGRIQGAYQRGIESVFHTSGTRPALSDDSAFLDTRFWGQGLLDDRKPTTKSDFIRSFQSWVYIAVKLNAQSLASVPLKLYVTKKVKSQKYKITKTRPLERKQRKWLYQNAGLDAYLTKAEDVEEVMEHPLLDLLKNVNPWQNRRDLWELTTMYSDLLGEAYWYIVYHNDKSLMKNLPAELWVMPSQFVEPKFGDSLKDLITDYQYKTRNTEVFLKPNEVIHFPVPNPNNPYLGFSAVRGVADAVYLSSQMNEFEEALFENRAKPGGIIINKRGMLEKEKERLEQKVKDKYSGAKKAGKTMILSGEGMDYIRDTMTPEELSYIEGRKLNRTEILAAFDVPEGAIISDNVNRANSETADYRHAKNGILPRIRRIEEKMNEKLVPLYGNDNMFVAFDNPVPQDKEFDLKKQTEQINSAIISPDEARSEEGRDPRGGAADELYLDNRKIPITSEVQPVTPTEEEILSFRDMVKESIKRKLL